MVLFFTAHQETWELPSTWKGTPGVGLEELGAVAKWLGKMLSHYFSFTIFGNLEVFFVSFLLLYHCFVILIKYSRAQRRQQHQQRITYMVTRLAWIAAKLVSSKRETRYASAASWSAITAEDWKRRSVYQTKWVN